jgi:putative transposase
MYSARTRTRCRSLRIAERWIGGYRREVLDRALVWKPGRCAADAAPNTRPITISTRPHRSLRAAAPLKPLPEPVDLERYRARRHTRAGGAISEYRLAA